MGHARVAEDYFHAAIVYQHGHAVADFERARALALQAVALDPGHGPARWLAAAAEDRRLWALGLPQRYGTQLLRRDGRWEVWPVDPAVTDADRAAWNVPPLAEAYARADRMNAGEAP